MSCCCNCCCNWAIATTYSWGSAGTQRASSLRARSLMFAVLHALRAGVSQGGAKAAAAGASDVGQQQSPSAAKPSSKFSFVGQASDAKEWHYRDTKVCWDCSPCFHPRRTLPAAGIIYSCQSGTHQVAALPTALPFQHTILGWSSALCPAAPSQWQSVCMSCT